LVFRVSIFKVVAPADVEEKKNSLKNVYFKKSLNRKKKENNPQLIPSPDPSP